MQEGNPQILLVAKLFILMGIGVILRKKNIIPEEGKKQLTDLIINLILPCSIISSFLVDLTGERLRQTGEIFVISLLIQLISFLIGHIAYRKCAVGHQTVMQYATVCSNSGILGTPIAEGIFGVEGTLLAAVFLIPLRVVMWTLGLSFFTKEAGKVSVKKVLGHPCIAAVFIGLIIMGTNMPLPILVEDCLRTVGSCNTAFSMILVGSIIADMDLHLLYHRDTLYYSAIRLVVLPLIALVGCRCIGTDPLVRNITVILTAMPAGATTSILTLKYNGDAAFASACTALTTVLSLLAVPLWCVFLLRGTNMNHDKWTHVLGNTWCLNLHVTIPVYFLNDHEIVLLDTGYAKLDRADLVALLEEKRLRVRAVLGSHSHNDHSGNHAYFQKNHGAEIILHDVEAAIVSDYSLMTVAYSPGTVEDMKTHFSELLLRADRTFRTEDSCVEIDGAPFGVIPLPGHTPGHTGIVTPDQVFYVGDAVLSEAVLKSAKLPSTRDWAEDIATKERMRSMSYPKYILAHKGIHEDITTCIELNIEDKTARAAQIAAWLREAGPVTLNEAEQLLWTKLELHSQKFLSQAVFRRNARCALEYLVREKQITRKFDNGTEVFECVN